MANEPRQFDPYHKWLGIPPGARPVTHYQLLGISRAEKDNEVIEDAAIRQSAHVRTYQLGEHGEICQRVLNEIATARHVLLDAKKRREYDATLPKRRPAASNPPTAAPSVAPAAGRGRSMVLIAGLTGAAALVVVVGLAVWLNQGSAKVDPIPVAQVPVVPNKADKTPKTPPLVKTADKSPEKPPVKTPETPGGTADKTPDTKIVDQKPPEKTTPRPDPTPDPKPDPKPVVENPPVKPEVKDPVAPKDAAARPTPDAAVLAIKQKELRMLVKAPGPKASIDDQGQYANMVLGLALQTKDDDAMRFVMLQEAFDVSYPFVDADVAGRSLAALGDYKVDPQAAKLAVLSRVAGKVTAATSATTVQTFVDAADDVVEDAIAGNDLKRAEQAAVLATNAARLTKSAATIATADRRLTQVRDLMKAFDAYQAAETLRKTQPDEAAACTASGRYLCLGLGEFEKGLPLLAKGSDAALKELAEEIARPSAPADQLALGEAWAEAAGRESGTFRKRAGSRALYWLYHADADTQGLARVKLASRIAEVEKVAPPPSLPEPVAGQLTSFLGNATAFSPGGLRLAHANGDKIIVRDLLLDRDIREFKGHAGGISSLVFSQDGKSLASGGADGTVRIWDVGSGSLRDLCTVPRSPYRLRFSADGKLLTFGAGDQTLRVWDLKAGKELRSINIVKGSREVGPKDISRSARFALTGGIEDMARVWNLETGKMVGEFNGKQHAYSGAISTDGKLLMTGGGNGARVWDGTTLKELHFLTGQRGHVYSIAITSDSRRAYIGTSEGEIRLYDLVDGKSKSVIGQHKGPAHLMELSPDQRRLVTSDGNTVTMWGLPR